MKYNKGFAPILILLSVFIAGVIGGGAYYLGKSSKVENKEIVENQTQNQVQNNINESNSHEVPTGPFLDDKTYIAPKPLVNNQSKMTTYNSKTFGYSIGYSGVDTNKVIVSNDGKNINLFPNQSNIDTLEVVNSPYIVPSYLSSIGTVKIGENQYKKFKDNNSSRQTYYLISGLQNNKSIFISVENDSDIPNYLDLSSLKINTVNAETFKNEPGEIKSIKTDGANKWLVSVDMLSNNPDWLPGVNDRYLNQNTKIRSLVVLSTTKAYTCGHSSTGNITGPDTLQNTATFLSGIKPSINKEIRNFDITGENITAMYDVCLP